MTPETIRAYCPDLYVIATPATTLGSKIMSAAAVVTQRGGVWAVCTAVGEQLHYKYTQCQSSQFVFCVGVCL